MFPGNVWRIAVAAVLMSLACNAQFSADKLRAVNRKFTQLPDNPDVIRTSEAENPGVIWIEGSDFAQGAIDLDVRGRDVYQKSFVGIAFHRKDDNTYECVYLRPFNFRADDPARHRHAVQYMALPDFDWPRLRQDFPDKYESSVDASLAATEWVHLKVVVDGETVRVYAGDAKSPNLTVQKLGQTDRGLVGLWTGNNSDGEFAHLRITPQK